MTTTQDFTTQGSTNLGADKIARSATAYALYNNGIWAGDKGLATVDQTDTYNSGSGTWNKPAGFDDNDTVLIEAWGGGGGGGSARDNATNSGGGGAGGAYIAYAVRYVDCPSTISYSVGSGGTGATRTTDGATNGTDGGDSTVTIGSNTFRANGGPGGTAVDGATTATGGAAQTPQIDSNTFSTSLWNSGAGGSVGDNGGGGIFGAAGGGHSKYNVSTTNTSGGSSFYGGNGGNGGATAGNGVAPGGGGGGAASAGTSNAGDGANGRIIIKVIRGWHPTVISR